MESIVILLIEDNEGDILLTREALGYGSIRKEISVVKDGWEAIQFLEKKGAYKNAIMPDLILLDINLPKLNGHEVLARIKSNPQIQHIPVIMLTTSSSESDILKSYQNHVNCFITKPIEADNFLETVAAIEEFWLSMVQLPKK
ncbi:MULTISPECIES: response regulator [Flavobacterium]|jgi:CheY-like chemotaxis protein|uniref:CheY-like chemotaxis protein n=1 Tax=Flavobacterium lindanitolerans TaxID=428988 RepID=A0A497TYB1_9FLAO|nr:MULTISPECIES: response regulator [Flavobacterium]KQS47459.1 two-component system response regulator [Flavobacterium sp. Leaf359]OJX54381.1 MAG: two-component system response regulator [Flavobacterium sp. 38-13]PKW29851.1 CheY-like chemotaxis protein [Flavobacterium lindanitolerans]RLJ24191.1 CheY-like chemotaxis protein [Flavobacterium lindanitolerans]